MPVNAMLEPEAVRIFFAASFGIVIVWFVFASVNITSICPRNMPAGRAASVYGLVFEYNCNFTTSARVFAIVASFAASSIDA
ncbi:hypothetical protein GS416_11790 [Rhodococcus hoagii]|nr:hypothetical protein [Prescottella equi]